MARAIGQRLVDIHGQHDHQFLLRPANQLAVLDDYAGCADLRERYAEHWDHLRELRQTQAELDASRTLRRQQLELYEFQAREIDAAEPTEGEFPELAARHRVLANIAQLQRDAGAAHAALYEADGSVSERTQAIAHLLIDLADMDDAVAPIAEQVRVSALAIQEAAYELSRYIDRLEHDPGEAAEVEQRLDALNRLVHKFGNPRKWSIEVAGLPSGGDDPLAPVLAYRELVGEQIDQLHAQDDDLDQLDARIAEQEQALAQLGGEMTALRTKAAKKLRPRVEAQLAELGMSEARFKVAISPASEPGPAGADEIEMLVQTNPGQEFWPLRKIASGGETSRIMLALKSILAEADRISVLVFDEIDANIGGRLGSVIGRKLRELAHGTHAKPGAGSHQVLCITHLPQIAAFGDRHFRIAKSVTGTGKDKRTRTEVAVLDGKPRIEELAEMMAGKQATATSRKQAKELLVAAGG